METTASAESTSLSQVMTKYQKEEYIINSRHRVYKVLNTPRWCMLDDRTPAYLVNLVGAPEEYAYRIPRAEVENPANFKLFIQPRLDKIEIMPARYQVDDWMLHIASSAIYQITDLPTDCVLEHNHQPAYGYRMKDGRRCFRAQREVEDQERFARVDAGFAALAMMQEDDPETQAAVAALPKVQRVIIHVGEEEHEGSVVVKQ